MTSTVGSRTVIAEDPVASPSQSKSGEPTYYSIENMVRRTYNDGGVVIACTKPLADGTRCGFEAERSGQIRSHVRYVAHQQDAKVAVSKNVTAKTKRTARRKPEETLAADAAVDSNTAEDKPRASRHGRKPTNVTGVNGFVDVPVSELLNIAQRMGATESELAQLRVKTANQADEMVTLIKLVKEHERRNAKLTTALTRIQSTLAAALSA